MCRFLRVLQLECSGETMGSGSSTLEYAQVDKDTDTRGQRQEWKLRIMSMRYKGDFEIEVLRIVYIHFANDYRN